VAKGNKAQGMIDSEERLWVSIDWAKAPVGKQAAAITVTGPQNNRITVRASINMRRFRWKITYRNLSKATALCG